jgi:hypothetical protein
VNKTGINAIVKIYDQMMALTWSEDIRDIVSQRNCFYYQFSSHGTQLLNDSVDALYWTSGHNYAVQNYAIRIAKSMLPHWRISISRLFHASFLQFQAA